MEYIPFYRPSITDAEMEAVRQVLSSYWLTTGPRVKEFEQKFIELTNAESALALNSCTAGLHLGLKVLGVGPGDEVITTPLTFCATANVIEHLGATTVLADIDPKSWLIDPQKITEKITARTKVILPVHFAGNMADMDTINQIAKENNLSVLEDCAHCLPNTYQNGKFVGDTQNLCSFSFYANKNITTGEGGMLTGPKELVEQCRSLSLHGMDRDAWRRFERGGSWQYDVFEPGFKYNMTDMQAALGLVQLAKLVEMFELKRNKALRYAKSLSKLTCVETPQPNMHSSFHIFPILIDPQQTKMSREYFINKMKEANIGTSVHYQPIHFFTYYAKKYNWQKTEFANASYVGDNSLSLPLYSSLTDTQQDYIIKKIEETLGYVNND
jgi:dTDP-4-amino-4,6-dideoxygalactose transaminase